MKIRSNLCLQTDQHGRCQQQRHMYADQTKETVGMWHATGRKDWGGDEIIVWVKVYPIAKTKLCSYHNKFGV